MTTDASEFQAIAAEAYVFAFPLVIMEMTRRVTTNPPASPGGNAAPLFAPMNRFSHLTHFPDDSFDAVVRPNADTLYSALWFDVSKEPLVITIPDSGGRYYVMPIMDMWSHVFASVGPRTTGSHKQVIAVVGPQWQGKLPVGIKGYRSPTATGWIIGRTQTNGVEDYPAVRAFQAGITAVPLSALGDASYVPPIGENDAALDMNAPIDQVINMKAAQFFSIFAETMKLNPPHFDDTPTLDRLARLGLKPGEDFNIDALSSEQKAALEAAPMQGLKRIGVALTQTGALQNGWRMILNPMGTYGTDYMRRAVIAFFGLGAVVVEDAIYPSALAQCDGQPFDSGAKYVMHFDKAELPPARAFWSLTMYNERQLFAANPISRFAIGDRDKLTFNEDGSLDLYIQREVPDDDKKANWLPAPASGTFSMNLRLYWPGLAALDGSWTPPKVCRK